MLRMGHQQRIHPDVFLMILIVDEVDDAVVMPSLQELGKCLFRNALNEIAQFGVVGGMLLQTDHIHAVTLLQKGFCGIGAQSAATGNEQYMLTILHI